MAGVLVEVFDPNWVAPSHLVLRDGTLAFMDISGEISLGATALCGKTLDRWMVTTNSVGICLSCRRAKEKTSG